MRQLQANAARQHHRSEIRPVQLLQCMHAQHDRYIVTQSLRFVTAQMGHVAESETTVRGRRQLLRQTGDVTEAEIEPLTGERMDTMCGIAVKME